MEGRRPQSAAATWFLSAMSFALVALPSAISTIAQLDKKGLRQAMGLFTAVLLLPRLAYSYDLAQGGLLIKSLNNINSRLPLHMSCSA